MDQLNFLVIIAPKNKGDKTVKKLGKLINYPSVTRGRGTAPNSMLAALGIGEPEKDVIFCFALKDDIKKIYDLLYNKLDFVQNHLGIAFSVPVSAVGGKLTYDILSGDQTELKSQTKGWSRV